MRVWVIYRERWTSKAVLIEKGEGNGKKIKRRARERVKPNLLPRWMTCCPTWLGNGVFGPHHNSFSDWFQPKVSWNSTLVAKAVGVGDMHCGLIWLPN